MIVHLPVKPFKCKVSEASGVLLQDKLGPTGMERGRVLTNVLLFSGVWKVVQQNVQPPRPHASPRRQQALQVPLLHQQVQPEGQPQPTHEGQTRHHGHLNRRTR